MTVYDYSAQRFDGTEESLSAYRGQVLLIVNTASQCGFTPQYTRPGIAVRKASGRAASRSWAFPATSSAPRSRAARRRSASSAARITASAFPMFAKIEVNGEGAHPLYKYLKDEKPGLLGTKPSNGISPNS